MTLAPEAAAKVQFNDEGYLVDTDRWTTELGESIADGFGIKLTSQHWQVIDFVRVDFAKSGASPGLRRIAQNTKVSIKELYQLFPKGPGKLVAKIGGVPKPKSCL